MLKKAFYFLTLCALSIPALSQEPLSPFSVGVAGGYLINDHTADFHAVPGCPSCSKGYKDGTGSRFGLGAIFAEYKIHPLITIAARFSYQDVSAVLKSYDQTTVIIDRDSTLGEFEHTIDAKLTSIAFQPSVKFNVFDNLNLNFGFSFASLREKNYYTKEEISKPVGVGTFVDSLGNDTRSRRRNEFSGKLKNTPSILSSLSFGASYMLPLNKEGTLTLEPEAGYYFGLTNILDDPSITKWKSNYIQLAAAVKYTFPTEKKILKEHREIRVIDTIIVAKDLITEAYFSTGKEISDNRVETSDGIELTTTNITRTDTLFNPKTYNIAADIYAVGVDSEGKEITNPKIIVEEFTSNKMKPLLNYVFFDNNSAVIPSRYRTLTRAEAEKFTLNDLYSFETLDVYYYILNVIGRRMKDNPSAKITLVGCNSDNEAEKGNAELSLNRAKAIKNYLTSVWGVEESRVSTEKRNLPVKASTPIEDAEKSQENRRVEFYSDNYEILSPIFLADTVRSANPPIVRFYPRIECEAGIKNWSLSVFQSPYSEKPSFAKEGSETPPKSIDWLVAGINSLTPRYTEPINYKIGAVDRVGKKIETAIKELPFELVTISRKRELGVKDKVIESYSLILFDFDKSDIIGTNKKIVDFLKKRITPESVITILGYSDRTGEDDYNLRLSEKRAITVKNAIDRKDATIQNVGEGKLLYNNDVPEGRFYCRTVDIVIETPIAQSQGKK